MQSLLPDEEHLLLRLPPEEQLVKHTLALWPMLTCVESLVISCCCPAPSPPLCSYFGFITKHPMLNRFACHVFVSQESMRPVAECVGWAQIMLFFSTARRQLVLTAISYSDALYCVISRCLCLSLLQEGLSGILPGASRIRLPDWGHLPRVRRNTMATTFSPFQLVPAHHWPLGDAISDVLIVKYPPQPWILISTIR